MRTYMRTKKAEKPTVHVALYDAVPTGQSKESSQTRQQQQHLRRRINTPLLLFNKLASDTFHKANKYNTQSHTSIPPTIIL